MSAKQCPTCGCKISYSEGFDAYYCEACNLWLEEQCSEDLCPYCKGRPEHPVKSKKKCINKKYSAQEKK